ncbi:MAG: DedA family protein [Candidatus Kaiserbacteria bacterium]|nr:DedA family protein [Candidatus Kaiserbacteria bacterium]
MPHLDLETLIKIVGYPGIFAIVFLESGVFFGFFLPGASMLFTGGLLASQGYFNPWVLIPLVTVAAILGDNAGYWFGNKVGIRLFLKPDSRFFRHEHVERAKRFYDKHGVRTVVLARFVPIVRTFVPIIAGVVKMDYRIFFSFNVIGALAWATGVTFLGYYLGEKVPFIQHYLTPIVIVIVIASLVPIFYDYVRGKSDF